MTPEEDPMVKTSYVYSILMCASGTSCKVYVSSIAPDVPESALPIGMEIEEGSTHLIPVEPSMYTGCSLCCMSVCMFVSYLSLKNVRNHYRK